MPGLEESPEINHFSSVEDFVMSSEASARAAGLKPEEIEVPIDRETFALPDVFQIHRALELRRQSQAQQLPDVEPRPPTT